MINASIFTTHASYSTSTRTHCAILIRLENENAEKLPVADADGESFAAEMHGCSLDDNDSKGET